MFWVPKFMPKSGELFFFWKNIFSVGKNCLATKVPISSPAKIVQPKYRIICPCRSNPHHKKTGWSHSVNFWSVYAVGGPLRGRFFFALYCFWTMFTCRQRCEYKSWVLYNVHKHTKSDYHNFFSAKNIKQHVKKGTKIHVPIKKAVKTCMHSSSAGSKGDHDTVLST